MPSPFMPLKPMVKFKHAIYMHRYEITIGMVFPHLFDHSHNTYPPERGAERERTGG